MPPQRPPCLPRAPAALPPPLLAKEKEQIRARLEKERTAAREVQRRALAARQEAVEGGRVLPVQLGIRDAFAGGARRHVRVEVPEAEVQSSQQQVLPLVASPPSLL